MARLQFVGGRLRLRCIGSVAMPMKRSGWAAMCFAIWSFWMAASVADSAAS